jgi:D-inositol-3-phosphate glycosyltransferase
MREAAGMRIALVSEHASPLGALGGVDAGGQNVYVAQLARHLGARGHAVDVLTRRDGPDVDEVVTLAPGVRVIHIPAGPPAFVAKEELLPWMEEFSTRVIDRAARERYDVLHANFWMSGLAAARVRAALGVPYVVTFHALGRVRRLHQGDADCFPDVRFAIEDHVVATATRVLAECPQDADDLVRLYAADRARLRVVPCGVDPAELFPVPRAEARAALGLDPDDAVVLQLGRLVPRKGVDTVIAAMARLVRERGVRARLLVVGGESDTADPVRTPEIARLRAVAEAEGIVSRVLFTGRRGRDRLRTYYSAADVFVTTPWYEPFGLTPLEAMACGTPVVGAAVGGIPFTVVDGETGFLVPPRDPDAVAERLAALLADPGLRAAMGARGRRRVLARFTWGHVATAVERAYREATHGRPAVRVAQPIRLAERRPVARRAAGGAAAVPAEREE